MRLQRVTAVTKDLRNGVPTWWAHFAAKAVYKSVYVDNHFLEWFEMFQKFRAMIVLGFIPKESVAHLGALGYTNREWYVPNEEGVWPDLFDWEVSFLERYCTSETKSVLIGGAGGGREPYHVAKRGYSVTAFDPHPFFAEAMTRMLPEDLHVKSFRGSYEDLPFMGVPAKPDAVVTLGDAQSFDYGIMGWCSFSHILDRADAIKCLKHFADVVNGPILISFFSRDLASESQHSRIDRIIRKLSRYNRDSSIGYQVHTGAYRQYSAEDMLEICAECDLYVEEAVIPKSYSTSAYIVVRPKRLQCPESTDSGIGNGHSGC